MKKRELTFWLCPKMPGVKTLRKGCSYPIDLMHPQKLTLQSLIMSILSHNR